MPVAIFLSYTFLTKPGENPLGCLLIPVLIVLYVLIDRYYKRTFGQVEVTKEYRREFILLSIAVMGAALLGMLVDLLLQPPISLFAISFAMVMLGTYIWMVRQAGGRNLAIFPAGLACIVLIFLSAFLPLLGDEVAVRIGFPSGWNFTIVAVGILYALYGVFEHLFLVRSLSSAEAVEKPIVSGNGI